MRGSPPSCLARRRALTLVELLVVLIVLAVLAAIVLPKFVDSGRRSKEAALRQDLKLIRGAVDRFYNDTGSYPASLAHLTWTVAPPKGLDSAGILVPIEAADWNGPYLDRLPEDPVARAPFIYKTAGIGVGNVSSASGQRAADGTAYSTW